MAETAPPTENVPIFNPIYWTINNGKEINVDYLDANYLKYPISQSAPEIFSAGLTTENDILFSNAVAGNRELVNVENIRMSQGGAGYIEFPDGTQQTTASGGAGFVSNPMSSNLDASNFNISNGGVISSFYLEATELNDAYAQQYYNYGAISSGVRYKIATASNISAMEGNIMFLLRCLEAGFKQEVLAEVIAFPDRSVIRIINNVCESDNIPISSIKYEEDPADPTIAVLVFECGISSSTCDIVFFQNGNDNNTLGSQFTPITTNTTIGASTNIFTDVDLELQTAGTSGNWRVKDTILANDTQTSTLGTNAIRELTPANDIQILNNINLNGTNIKNVNTISTDNIGSNVASEITSSTSINLGGNDLQNTQNVYVDSLRENTLNNDIVVHNTLNMNNNHIHNLDDPTQNKDGANKQYVDNAVAGGLTNPLTSDLDGGNFRGISFADPVNTQDLATKNYVDLNAGGVQNPMVANLDCGSYTITNSTNIQGSTIQTQPNLLTGRMLSNGIFTHGGVSAGEFQANGTIHRFAPSDNFRIQNFAGTTTYFDYEQSSQILTTQNGATQAIDTGSKLTFSSGGTLQLHLNPSVATQNEELSLLNVGGGQNQILQTQGQSNSVPNIPQSLNPIICIPLKTDDVAVYAPFTLGLGWDNSSDGSTILLPDLNSITGHYGEPAGLNNNQVSCFPFYSYICGVGISNASINGGWVCNGASTIELVYTLTGLIDQSFVPPIYVAQVGSSFTAENIQIPQTSWIYANRLLETGISLSLKLNIPVGSTIDTQDPLNARVVANKVQIAVIDML
jgi:hypothetical protein